MDSIVFFVISYNSSIVKICVLCSYCFEMGYLCLMLCEHNIIVLENQECS